jgi:hypothetical protein
LILAGERLPQQADCLRDSPALGGEGVTEGLYDLAQKRLGLLVLALTVQVGSEQDERRRQSDTLVGAVRSAPNLSDRATERLGEAVLPRPSPENGQQSIELYSILSNLTNSIVCCS